MLAQFYLPTVGGEERHVHDLSVALTERGYEVSVATLWHEGQPEFEIQQGVRIHRIRGSMQRVGMLFSEKIRQHAPPFPDPEVVLALRRIVKQEKPDIVHAHNWLVHSFLPLKAWSNAKLVVTLHDTSLVCAQKRYMYHKAVCSGPALGKCLSCASEHYGKAKGVTTALANGIGRHLEYRLVDKFIPVSQAMADISLLEEHGASYRVIPNFVPDNVTELPAEESPLLEQLPKGEFMLFIGEVKRDKGADVLFQAYAEMNTDVPLVLIGRPINDFDTPIPPHVQIFSSWPHDAVMQAWSRCTLALAPSTWVEAFGIVAIEAMAMGRPLIASDIGGLSDIVVDEQTGLLVPPGDAEALRGAMQRLLADPERRKRMGEAAKQRVNIFKASTVVPQIEQIYAELLHEDISQNWSDAYSENRSRDELLIT
jgi:glycosyltransferase involved in cell wall biosynthesis